MNPEAAFSLLEPLDRQLLADWLTDAGRVAEADLARTCPDPTRLAWQADQLVARPWTVSELLAVCTGEVVPPSYLARYVARMRTTSSSFSSCQPDDLAAVRAALDLDPEDWNVWILTLDDPVGEEVLLVCWSRHFDLIQ